METEKETQLMGLKLLLHFFFRRHAIMVLRMLPQSLDVLTARLGQRIPLTALVQCSNWGNEDNSQLTPSLHWKRELIWGEP